MKRRFAAAQLELVQDDREGNLKRALALAGQAVEQARAGGCGRG